MWLLWTIFPSMGFCTVMQMPSLLAGIVFESSIHRFLWKKNSQCSHRTYATLDAVDLKSNPDLTCCLQNYPCAMPYIQHTYMGLSTLWFDSYCIYFIHRIGNMYKPICNYTYITFFTYPLVCHITMIEPQLRFQRIRDEPDIDGPRTGEDLIRGSVFEVGHGWPLCEVSRVFFAIFGWEFQWMHNFRMIELMPLKGTNIKARLDQLR